MSSSYQILNLVNGLTLVGDVEWSTECATIRYPLEVTANSIANEEGRIVGEHMVLKPYLVMSEETDVSIDQLHILTSCTLAERLAASYEDMVSSVYFSSKEFSGEFLHNENVEEIEDDITNMSVEDRTRLKEQVDNLIENMSVKKPDDGKLH
jgi:VIT1/CCC1 family predicted Fe2+/Mn2+ transporter